MITHGYVNIKQREDQQLASQGYSVTKQDVHTGFDKTLFLSLHRVKPFRNLHTGYLNHKECFFHIP